MNNFHSCNVIELPTLSKGRSKGVFLENKQKFFKYIFIDYMANWGYFRMSSERQKLYKNPSESENTPLYEGGKRCFYEYLLTLAMDIYNI